MKKADVRDHVLEKFAKNEVSQILQEGRLPPQGGHWIPRELVHLDEVTREHRIKSVLPPGDPLLVVAIHPSTGLFGAFEVPKPQPELDLQSGGSKAADEIAVAAEAGALHLERTHRAARCANDILEGITSGKIKHYEQLAGQVPPDVSFDTVQAILWQARKQPMLLESKRGVIKLGGWTLSKDGLPCSKTYVVKVDVRAIDDDGRPNGTVSFKVDQRTPCAPDAPGVLRNGERIQAALATSSDARSLALLHYAKFCQQQVELELRMDYLYDRRWDIKAIRIANEKEIIAGERSAQEVVRELF